eukprot:NODE_388_length_9508_cov_0.225954.p5 type:complete len:336 gc:universal NODE_388_length_9508_cov_0.225954:9344-8337(-)
MQEQDYVGAANEMLNQSIVKNYKFCKEYIDEYKDRKREIHYLQHDIELKKKEITHIENQISSEEKQMDLDLLSLRDDSSKFNEYLKQSDKVCIDAIKRAELESKMKQEKVNEAKQLTTQTQVLRNEIAKKHDVLKELEEYQEFFNRLGNKDWNPLELTQFMSKLEQENLELLLKFQQIQQRQLKECLVEVVEKRIVEDKLECQEDSNKHFVKYKPDTLVDVSDLNHVVQRVYKSCVGPEQLLNTFQMLGEIESKVNEIMEKFDKIPYKEQSKIRKALDKKIREYEHTELVEKQKQKIVEKSEREHIKRKVKVSLKKKKDKSHEQEIDVEQDFFWK